jgi:xylulokinase
LDHVIGIDIGTSAVKVIVVDADERVVASVEAPLETSRPRPGWAEQDPDAWWQTTAGLLDALARDHAPAMARTGAIGLSGQSHATVLLDGSDKPLRPAILWNDGRASAEAREIGERYPGLPRKVGVLCMPSFTAPKMLWLARHDPGAVQAMRTLLLPKDYVGLHLTGERVTDMSDAAGTWWLDEGPRRWCAEALAASQMPETALPRLTEGSERTGTLRPALARRWGMPDGVAVAAGAGDAACGAIGIGAVENGDAFLQIGTSAQLFVTVDSYRPSPETAVHAFAHGLPGRWYVMGAMLNGASCLAFASRLFGMDVSDLLAEMGERPARPSQVMFLPYLAGERTPHNDADARGVFFGLDPDTPRRALVQAVLEGVAFAFADCRDALAAAGTVFPGAGVTGGGARSAAWMGILADVLGIPLTRYRDGGKGPAFGAARLGRMARDGSGPGICTRPEILDVTQPDDGRHAAYAERLGLYRDLYQALRPSFAADAVMRERS